MLRLTDADVAEFAAASGDVNPLHVDADFARNTPYGRPIVHGVLTVIAALAAVPGEQLRAAGQLTVRFARPVLTGTPYRVAVHDNSIEVSAGDMTVSTIDLVPGLSFDTAVTPVDRVLPAEPETPEPSGLATGDRFGGDYAVASLTGLRALADRLGAKEVPDALLAALAWSSWFVGMRLPGRDSLFSRLRVRVTTSEPHTIEPRYVATLRTADPRTGTTVISAGCTGRGAALEAELRAFHRPAVPVPTWSSATSLLPSGDGLAGSRVLVVGGSRGVGAAVVSVLVAQGATVWAAHRAAGSIDGLQREFGADRVRPLVLDAADEVQVRTAFAELGDVRFDGVVLSAGPSVFSSTVHPDNTADIRSFVDTSIAMALLPLSSVIDRIVEGGWLALMSSSAVEDMPEHWPHYAMAKSAIESLGRYCARRRKLRVLLARAPKMWTEMSNGPLGRVGAVPPEQVASAIVHWVLTPPAEPVTVLASATLADWHGPQSHD
jgi:NAD(P)-dependent dehydrogenase (short-subunit alcohol dehydrogenase family)